MDGSVTIGVSLDTSSVLSALTSLETRVEAFGIGLGDALVNPVLNANLSAVVISAVEGMASAVISGSAMVYDAMTALGQGAASLFSSVPWRSTGEGAVSTMAAGMDSASGMLYSAAERGASAAAGAFAAGAWQRVGYNIMSGVADGIYSAGGEVVRAIEKVAYDAEHAVKEYYEISSPSGLMRDEVGVMISRGIAEGILSGSSYVSAAMEGVSAMSSRLRGTYGDGTDGTRALTQNIYLRDSDSSPYFTAKRIRKESEAVFRQP